MHRQRTKLAKRMNRVFTHRADRVAKAIERQGIRATYELHDRLLSNRTSRDRFGEARPELDDLQQSILSDVRRQGYSVRSFHDLFPDGKHWRELEEQRDRFVATTEADLAAGGEHVRVRPGKEFVVRLQSYGVELGHDDPWFRAVSSHRLLDIGNAYLEMWSKLEYVDVWYSVPQPAAGERISSQRWHRDYNDKHLLKVFLYLVDVDEDMGPFQYVAGSQPGRPVRERLGLAAARPALPDRGRAGGPRPGRRRADVHRACRHARLLQHRRVPPRRLLDDRAARARDGDLLHPGLARLTHSAELHVRGRTRRARPCHAVRLELTTLSQQARRVARTACSA